MVSFETRTVEEYRQGKRTLRPGVVVRARRGGLRKQLEVGDRLGTVTKGSTTAGTFRVRVGTAPSLQSARHSHAVVTRVTSTDDDNVLALCREVAFVFKVRVEERSSVELQELHGCDVHIDERR